MHRGVLLALVAALLLGAVLAKKSVKKQLKPDADFGAPILELPEVALPLGRAQGRWIGTRAGRQVAAFAALPYALPPVNDLRFKAPRPAKAWKGLHVSPAYDQVPQCVQPRGLSEGPAGSHEVFGQEDCLFLNVFTPNPSNSSKLPVLVWIHGGAFAVGGSALYGPEILLDRDVVLVTLNYRLGPFGFLSTEDEECVGNWGLKDQTLALRWVTNHIHYFGGDPNLITLLGQSAGGVSTHLHVVSPHSKGLFQRAVSQSGTALMAGVPQSRGLAARRARQLAALVGCPTTPSWKLVQCLRERPPQQLAAQDAAMRSWGVCPLWLWAPVVEEQGEEAFLTEQPADTLARGLAHDVPWMSGITSAESAHLIGGMARTPRQMEVFSQNLGQILPVCLGYNETASNVTDITAEIKEFYFDSEILTSASVKSAINLFSDGMHLWPLDEAMRLHAAYSSAPAFMYLFNHRGARSFTDQLGDSGLSLGVSHGDDILYMFPLVSEVPQPEQQLPEDQKVSERLLDLLVNFATHGNPTPEGDLRFSFQWHRVESDDLEFVEVGQGGRLLKGSGLLGLRAHFWATLPLSERHIDNMRASFPTPEGQQRDEL